MRDDKIDALMLAIGAIPPRPRPPSALRVFVEWMIISTVFMLFVGIAASMFVDAAIKEQAFNDNVRRARCERMDDIERNVMKGYCK